MNGRREEKEEEEEEKEEKVVWGNKTEKGRRTEFVRFSARL